MTKLHCPDCLVEAEVRRNFPRGWPRACPKCGFNASMPKKVTERIYRTRSTVIRDRPWLDILLPSPHPTGNKPDNPFDDERDDECI